MKNSDKRPRHYAVDLVDAWVRGEDPAPILARMPANFRDLARAHARIFCEQIQFHRRAGTDLDTIKGEQLAAWVRAYRNRMALK